MSKHQTRRSISFARDLYDRIGAESRASDMSISGFADWALRDVLGMHQRELDVPLEEPLPTSPLPPTVAAGDPRPWVPFAPRGPYRRAASVKAPPPIREGAAVGSFSPASDHGARVPVVKAEVQW